MEKFAYKSPDEFRPEEVFNFEKVASKPYMGITAFVAGRPHLVTAFDGSEYTLEDTKGETIQLDTFDWDPDDFVEDNSIVAATRVEGSPLESGREVDGQTVGELTFNPDTGSWAVSDTAGGEVDLTNLIDQLEANGWQVDEEVELHPDDKILKTIERAASASCTDCKDEDCDSSSCQCPCHESKESANYQEDAEDLDHSRQLLRDEGDKAQGAPTPPLGKDEFPFKDDGYSGPSPGPEERGTFQGTCENCGNPHGEHTIDGMRCPTDAVPKETPDESRIESESRVASFAKTTDTNGEALKAGDFYDLHSKNYVIPDTIKLIQITPDLLVATTHEGSITLTIKPEEIESEGYTFEPLFPSTESDTQIEASFIETMPIEKTARKKFSPLEQKALVDEPGVARNRHKLRLDDSHYAQEMGEEESEEDFDIYFL